MAGPSVMVRILGDASNLAKSFQTTGEKAKGAAGQASAAFGSLLGTLNQTGVLGPFGEALGGINDALANMVANGKHASDALLGAGGVLVGTGTALAALGSKDKAAQQQLAAAIEATGHSFEDYGSQIEAAIKHEERYGNSAVETQQALQALTEATHDPAKALTLLNTATDLAAAKHEDLATAATQVGKVYNGNTKILKEFGVNVTSTSKLTTAAATATRQAQTADDNLAKAKQRLADLEAIDAAKKHLTVAEAIALRNAQQAVVDATTKASDAHQKAADATQALTNSTKAGHSAVDQLSQVLKGQAAASADTFTGHLKAIKTEIEDQAAKLGQKYGPALQGVGAAMAGLGAAMKVAAAAQDLFTSSTEAAAVAEDTLAASEVTAEAAGLPLIATVGLVVAALAALGVAAYEVYTHWATIWKAIKAAVVDVWDWIKGHWPLLVDILLGPIGIAATQIYQHWHAITAGAAAVLDWLRQHWPLILAILGGPFGLAVLEIERHWHDILGLLEGVPAKIAHIARGMWDGIANAFVDAINYIIHIWDDLHFKAPGFSVFGHHIGGFDIGLPHIPDVPHLAQGGLITADGLVYAHAGEAITPIDKAPRGPVVHIDHAHFNSDVDVEAFMRKVAWTVQTQRI